MTTAQTYHPPHLIDIAPLAARYEVMTGAILAFIAAGHMELVLRYSQKLLRVVRVYNRLDRANILVRRKLDMLCDREWRERVLRDLGGIDKLRRWEAANARFRPRDDTPDFDTKTAASVKRYGPLEEQPAWLNTPERIAESERLKARKREIMRACAHPNIVRDRVKVDFDGLFRLPPLPRQKRVPANVKIYTQNTIVDYDWNSIPFAKETGLGPAMVWPREFYAAMGLDGEVPNYDSVIPAQARRAAEPGPNAKDSFFGWVPAQGRDDKREVRNDSDVEKDDKVETSHTENNHIPLLPLHDVLSPKTYRALFEDPV